MEWKPTRIVQTENKDAFPSTSVSKGVYAARPSESDP